IFSKEDELGALTAEWTLDPSFTNDILVKLTFTAAKSGYYSIATPTLASVTEADLQWGIVPGQWQGNAIQKNFVLAYGYGQGIPDRPVIARDRTSTTLAPLLSTKNGLTLAVI